MLNAESKSVKIKKERFSDKCNAHPILFNFLIEFNNKGQEVILNNGNVKRVNFDRKSGIKRTISSLFLAYPSGGFHGMWIELKRSRLLSGALTKEQREWQSAMRELGYKAIVCHREQDAYDEIIAYLNLHTKCKECGSENINKKGFNDKSKQRYICTDCKSSFI
jgi:hypothetical protein